MMNKALPWNINGVGFDAREAAREAARRQGKSLGEWLHGVIADHADEQGVHERDIVGQDRVNAVTARLERMSARAASYDRRTREDRPHDRARPARHDDEDDLADMPLRGRSPPRSGDRVRPKPTTDGTDFLLEEAIEAMERRAVRAERRTDDALASFAKLLETNESRREDERASVTAMAQKLSDIEARLSGDENESPIKGALARLEARLETIARRDTAEGYAKPSATMADYAFDPDKMVPDSTMTEPMRRLEEKLNDVLRAVSAHPLRNSTSPIAIAASRDIPPRPRRLGEAITEIADRQRMLDDPDAPKRHPAIRHDEPRQAQAFAAMQNDIAALTSKIDALHTTMATRRSKTAHGPDIDDLHAQIAAMSKSMGNQPDAATSVERFRDDTPAFGKIQDQMREIRDLISSSAPVRVDLEPIENRIAALTERLNQPARVVPSAIERDPAFVRLADEDLRSLENSVRDLGAKIEAAQAPGAGASAIDALQQQVAALAVRFERSETGLSSLTGLEQSMRHLFAHLEKTRAEVESAASKAAREAVRLANAERRVTPAVADEHLAALRAIQEEAGARTQSTLKAVHQTLEKVVDRLATVEHDIASNRALPKIPATEPLGSPPSMTESRVAETRQLKAQDERRTKNMKLGAPDPFEDPMFGSRKTAEPARKPQAPRTAPSELDDEAGRADFIAAARRAAQAAQAAGVTDTQSLGAGTESDLRAGLLAKSRDYVASHKRPLLLSLAAIFVVLGTLAIMQRIGLDDGASTVASYTAPAKVVGSAEAPVRSTSPIPASRLGSSAPSSDLSGELTPSALPRPAPSTASQIPGSDPIQTGSIASLPAFAAQGAIAPPATRQGIPPGLQAMADAGNGAAAFELGARYAEGRGVARDMKLAATWYETAAAQGLAPAQYRLASLYEKGLGVAQDKLRARALYTKAADAGNPRAMHNLAVLLADGNGNPDYEAAATWFRKAAQYGVHDSQYNLAILLARGLGVQQSMVQSYQWFAIAAAQNDADAATKRDEVASKLSAGDLAVGKALVAAFRPRSANAAATEVQPPAGGWDGAAISSPLNSARPKISSL